MSAGTGADKPVAMITGAAGNLGRAVAAAFEQAGYALVLVDLSASGLAAAYGAGSADRLLAPTNLLDAQQVETTVRAAMDRFGRLDVLCNLAGGFRMGEAVHETSDRTWDFLFDLNARTVLHVARAVVPRMLQRGGGRIVNVGAASAQKGVSHMGAYTAAKAVVARLTEAMSGELREQGINVNCVLPTIIDTPENRAAMPDADPARWVSPHDLARVVRFLASEEARAIHGAALPVSGLS